MHTHCKFKYHSMDIVSRLKQYLDHEQISVTQFADYCGIPRPSASQLLNGRNKKVSDEVISKIHTSYPSLSMLWLLFGEGDMITMKNIETSEPQTRRFSPDSSKQETENQPIQREFVFAENHETEMAEKNQDVTSESGSGYMLAKEEEQAPYGFPASRKRPTTQGKPDPDSFTFTTDTGKRVMSIVVYYDDNSFESFIPDPSRHNPFVR